jgi:zinc D-Ala-D-Ala carboxypeptidase
VTNSVNLFRPDRQLYVRMQYSRTREHQLSNSDRSRPAHKSAPLAKAEDIPAALRDGNKTRSNSLQGMTGTNQLPLGAIAIGVGLLLAGGAAFTFATTSREPPATSNAIASSSDINQSGSQTTANSQSNDTDNVLNHPPIPKLPIVN